MTLKKKNNKTNVYTNQREQHVGYTASESYTTKDKILDNEISNIIKKIPFKVNNKI